MKKVLTEKEGNQSSWLIWLPIQNDLIFLIILRTRCRPVPPPSSIHPQLANAKKYPSEIITSSRGTLRLTEKLPLMRYSPASTKIVKELLTVDGDGAHFSSRWWSHGLNLPNEKALFVCELVIIGSIL